LVLVPIIVAIIEYTEFADSNLYFSWIYLRV
jgi:hypothetical protein